jgi:hypothetical protein
VYALAPQYTDSDPSAPGWLQALGADYLGLWEAGTDPYLNHYGALDFCNNSNVVPAPDWWAKLNIKRIDIINDCQDASTMKQIAEKAIERHAYTVWITKGVEQNGKTVYDIPPYFADEVNYVKGLATS